MAKRRARTAKPRRSIVRRARRAAARVRTIVRRSPVMARIRRRRRSSAGSGGIGGGIIPAGLIKTAAYTGGGFLGFSYIFQMLAERFPQLSDPNQPWVRIAGKAGAAILVGWLIRKYAHKQAGLGLTVGGLIGAIADAWVQFQASRQAGLGEQMPALTSAPTGLYLGNAENAQQSAANAANRMMEAYAASTAR